MPNRGSWITAIDRLKASRLVLGFAFGLAYLLGAELGRALSLPPFPDSFATFWPPNGLFLAVLLVTTRRTWPLTAAAALAASIASDVLVHGHALSAGLGYGLANTVETVGSALLVRRLVARPITFQRVQEVLLLCGAVMLVIGLGGLIGASVARADGAPFATAWNVWWCGHVLGVVLFTPFVVIARRRLAHFVRTLPARPGVAAEAATLAMVVAAEVQFVWSATTVPRAVLFAPPFLWAAFRFGVGGTAATNVGFLVLALVHTRLGRGPYGAGGLEQLLVGQWQFAALSAIFLITAAVLAEHKQAETALRESEARNRAILEAQPDMICVNDADGTYLACHASDSTLSLLPPSEMLGRTISEALPADVAELLLSSHRKVLHTGIPELSVEYQASADGGTSWFETRIVPCGHDRTLSIVRNVSDRKRLEAELRQSQKLEAIGRLAGGVAHDFSNLLTVMGGNADLVLATLPPQDPNRESITQIKDSAVLGASVTRRLLTFSRRQQLQPRVLNLNDVVAASEKMLRRLIGGDVVMTCVMRSLSWRVRIDPDEIEQVVMNLALNARDAMPGGGTLVIETREVVLREEERGVLGPGLNPGHHVVLTVSDNGWGMTPEVKERIFEPFYTTKDLGKGTGLGLSTVYGIVQQSNGYITVDSALGTGTVFNIYFPAAAEGRATEQDVAPTGS